MRRNNEWHHFDPLDTAGIITNGCAQVVSNNLDDRQQSPLLPQCTLFGYVCTGALSALFRHLREGESAP
ncbi:MAG: hypothetical protein ACUVRT_00010 [Armatimonadota bacterium]